MNERIRSRLLGLARAVERWVSCRVIRRGRGHRIEWGNARIRGTRVELHGEGAVIKVGRGARLADCEIILRGKGVRLVLGEQVKLTGVRLVVEDAGSELEIGGWTSMTRATLQAKEGKRIQVGKGCMVGHGVEIVNSDGHSLLDAETGERLNPAGDVVLEDRVWLAAGVFVGKGVRLGADTVVAGGSRVLRSLPAGVLAAGTPAVVKRTGVKWKRKRIGIEE